MVDIHLEEQSIALITYCYLVLYKDVIDEFLGTDYTQKDVEAKVNAYIK